MLGSSVVVLTPKKGISGIKITKLPKIVHKLLVSHAICLGGHALVKVGHAHFFALWISCFLAVGHMLSDSGSRTTLALKIEKYIEEKRREEKWGDLDFNQNTHPEVLGSSGCVGSS